MGLTGRDARRVARLFRSGFCGRSGQEARGSVGEGFAQGRLIASWCRGRRGGGGAKRPYGRAHLAVEDALVAAHADPRARLPLLRPRALGLGFAALPASHLADLELHAWLAAQHAAHTWPHVVAALLRGPAARARDLLHRGRERLRYLRGLRVACVRRGKTPRRPLKAAPSLALIAMAAGGGGLQARRGRWGLQLPGSPQRPRRLGPETLKAWAGRFRHPCGEAFGRGRFRYPCGEASAAGHWHVSASRRLGSARAPRPQAGLHVHRAQCDALAH